MHKRSGSKRKNKSMTPFFNSSQPKVEVSFSECNISVGCVCYCHKLFTFLSFNQTWHKASSIDEDLSLFKWRSWWGGGGPGGLIKTIFNLHYIHSIAMFKFVYCKEMFLRWVMWPMGAFCLSWTCASHIKWIWIFQIWFISDI